MSATTRHIPATAALAAVAFLLLPVSAVQPLWVAILAAMAALAGVADLALCRHRPRTGHLLTGLMAAIVAWGALSAIWSIDTGRSLDQALRLGLIGAGAFVLLTLALDLDETSRRRVETFLMAGFALGIAFIAFEILTGGYFHGALHDFEKDPVKNLFFLNRASSVAAIAVWAAVIPVWRRFGASVALGAVVVTFIALKELQPDTSLLAMIIAGTVFAVAWVAPRIAAGLLITGLVVVTVGAPFLFRITAWATRSLTELGLAEFSLSHRLAIWHFASQRVDERLLLGWGLDASRSIGSGALVGVKDAPGLSARAADALPLHPHNATLQIWLELGAVGATLVTALVVVAILAILARITSPMERAAALAMTASAIVIAELSFGIWQGWWLATLWLLGIVTVALLARRTDPVTAN